MKRFLTGLDWSGDPGDPRKSNRTNTYLVVATCTVDLEHHSTLDDELHALRRDLGYGPQHVFRHADSQVAHRELFFDAMSEVPIRIACLCVDKSTWSHSYVSSTTGPERIRHLVENHVLRLTAEHVSGQKLLVDMTRDEAAFVSRIRKDLTLAMKFKGAKSFSKVVARPDDRPDAGVIQVADMFAGEVRSRGGDMSWGIGERFSIYRDDD